MPRSDSGKWVSRAAATGGGRTYRGQIPVNWYAALVVIVILGLVSIVFSRYEYQHPHTTPTVAPTVGQTLYAAFAIDVCGTVQSPLAASTNSAVAGVTTPGEDVLNVSPRVKGQAGVHATIGQFFTNYPHGKLSSKELSFAADKVYVAGKDCPAGTPDAGKKAVIKAEVWPNAVLTKGKPVTGNPALWKIGSRTLITIGYVPAHAKLPRPAQSTINAMLQYAATVSNSTTTTTTTTTPSSSTTTTTAPSGTTTTTTAPSGTTTTTK